MKFLIICTFFPPDTEIGAVKPYMIAKYLSQFGHDVTVLRMGYFKEKGDPSYGDYRKGIEVLTAQGDESDAARFERGEAVNERPNGKIHNLPKGLDLFLRFTMQPVIVYRRKRRKDRYFALQKKVIDELKEKGREFDVVYSTFFMFENIFAGEYAAKLFHSKWVMEFRDPIDDTKVIKYPALYAVWRAYAGRVQKHAVETSDLCICVSEGLADKFRGTSPQANIEVIYNGYNSESELNYCASQDAEHFSICYTGTMYDESIEALESLLECLRGLVAKSKINRKKIRFHYAGRHSAEVKSAFQKYELSDILIDHQYVTRKEAERIQCSSDLFLVLSWNTKTSQGILTGKFYEGIRAGKPILSVITGDMPNSELLLLNEKYQYGFCYEICQKVNMFSALKKFLLDMYNQKFSDEGIVYNPNKDLKEVFHYENITRKFERLCEGLVENR